MAMLFGDHLWALTAMAPPLVQLKQFLLAHYGHCAPCVRACVRACVRVFSGRTVLRAQKKYTRR